MTYFSGGMNWGDRLQWGRALSSAEMCLTGKAPAFYIAASVGPRPFERGNAVHPLPGARHQRASVRPRPFERGNCTARNY